LSSSGDGSGNGIGISGCNGSGSSGTCGSSWIAINRGGSKIASEAGLSGFEYGPLESNDEDCLSATELVRTIQAGDDEEAKIQERLLAELTRKAPIGTGTVLLPE